MYSKRTDMRELTADDVRVIAPSVFARRPASTRTDAYNFIPTNKVIERMVDAGYGVYGAMQAKTRVKENEGFQKHLIVLRHKDDIRSSVSSCPELLLINSHNGGGAFRLLSGEVRFACDNGLIIMDGQRDDIRVSHKCKDAIYQVHLDMMELREKAIKHKQVTAAWKQIDLLRADAEALYRLRADMFNTRWVDRPELQHESNYMRVNARRRQEDRKYDLYTQMNVIQENIIRGGMRLYDYEERAYTREVSEVKSIDTRVAINRALWDITAKFAREYA